MKIVALALAAALMTACSPGSGDALPPSATPSSQPPSEALTMACAQFGSAPVTDLARLIALENPAERDRGLADISDTVIGIASDVEQAAASAPGTQAAVLARNPEVLIVVEALAGLGLGPSRPGDALALYAVGKVLSGDVPGRLPVGVDRTSPGRSVEEVALLLIEAPLVSLAALSCIPHGGNIGHYA